MSKNIGIKNMNNIFLCSSKKNWCDISRKYKVMHNSNQSVIPQYTKVRRNVNTILYSLGGRTQYGLQPLGKFIILTENKNIEIPPIKNKF